MFIFFLGIHIFVYYAQKEGINMNTFATAFKHYLIEHNISQSDLAIKCNISPQAVSNLLNRDNISLDKMNMLVNAVGCELVFGFVSTISD